MSASESTFRQMWATRPSRIPPKRYDEGSLFGVCQGIAARYQVNVYLIRVLFLFLFFVSTGGFFVYVLCIFLMPKMGRAAAPVDALRKPKGPLTPEEKNDRTTGWLALNTLVGYVFAVTVGLGATYTVAALACVFIFLVGWWLVHQRYPEPPGPPMPHAEMQPRMPGLHPGAPGNSGPPHGYGAPSPYPAARPGQVRNPYEPAHPGYEASPGFPRQAPYPSQAGYNAGSKTSRSRGRSKYVTFGEKKPEDPQLLFTRLGIALGVVSILGLTVSIVFRIFG